MFLCVLQFGVVVMLAVVVARIRVNGLVVVTVGARAAEAVFGAAVGASVVVSRQPPSHPCFTHEVSSISDVSVGLVLFGEVVGDNVVVSRQPPNHPYFTHEVLGRSVVDVELEELVELVVVVSSRHPIDVSYLFGNHSISRVRYPTIQASCKSWFVSEVPLTKYCCSLW
jgi:hypothetical protein